MRSRSEMGLTGTSISGGHFTNTPLSQLKANLSVGRQITAGTSNWRSRSAAVDRFGSAQTKDGEQCGVDSPLFFRCEMAGEIAEPLKVDGTDLFDKHATGGAVDVYLGSE